jgi:F0F1-type ATP synthase membrane subunit b/b'
MPQFDLTTFGPQFFWLILLFLLLYSSMYYWIVPKMKEVLEKRWEKTGGKLQKSEDILLQAQNLGKEYQKIIHEAQHKAFTFRKETQKKLYLDLLQEKHRINDQILLKIKVEKNRIEKEKRSFLQEIEDISENLSHEVYDKIAPILKTEESKDGHS